VVLLLCAADDEAWLPAENGCTEVWGLMQEVPDQILHLALLTFADPSAATLKVRPAERVLQGAPLGCVPAGQIGAVWGPAAAAVDQNKNKTGLLTV